MAPRPTVVGSSTTSYAFDDNDDDNDNDDIMALNMNIMHIDPNNTKLHTAAEDLGFYKNEEEQTGVGELLFSLTKEEVESFPDEQMPLRHYRAEDVRSFCYCFVLYYYYYFSFLCVTVVQAVAMHGCCHGGSNKESCWSGNNC